jgi:hypothetical protein
MNRIAPKNEDAQSALDCGGSTPLWSSPQHYSKAASTQVFSKRVGKQGGPVVAGPRLFTRSRSVVLRAVRDPAPTMRPLIGHPVLGWFDHHPSESGRE